MISRAKQIWAELDEAQRRLFEIQTGIPAPGPKRNTRSATHIDELERLYRRDSAAGSEDDLASEEGLAA
jgi:hypothetical protein